jgi:hypothetical protein
MERIAYQPASLVDIQNVILYIGGIAIRFVRLW